MRSIMIFVILSIVSPTCHCIAYSHRRRLMISLPFVTAASHAQPISTVNALDVDGFIERELTNDSKERKRNLKADEALCKYGQPGKDRGDACVRAGIPIKDVYGKKNGTVNAYGEVDRGSYVRCQQFYELEEEGYVKKTYCE